MSRPSHKGTAATFSKRIPGVETITIARGEGQADMSDAELIAKAANGMKAVLKGSPHIALLSIEFYTAPRANCQFEQDEQGDS